MINLVYPKEDTNRFVIAGNIIFGPFGQTNYLPGELIHSDESLSSMKEKRGPYRQNSVDHEKFECDITYHPLFSGLISNQSTDYPRALKFYGLDYAGVSRLRTEGLYGLATPGGSTIGRLSPITDQPLHYAFDRDANGVWTIYMAQMAKGMPQVINVISSRTFTNIAPIGDDSVYFRFTETSYKLPAGGLQHDKNWRQMQSYATIKSLFKLAVPVSTVPSYWVGKKTKIPLSNLQPPPTVLEKINTRLHEIFPYDSTESAQGMLPWGDVAKRAIDSTDIIDVNVYEFLRDLRHISDLKLKLNGLRTLKGLSGNYLKVKYGFLPSLSDIQTLLEACRSRHPHLDVNGFEVYTGLNTYKETDFISVTLEQRVKVAIDKENTEFQALLNRLISFGIIPSFEDIWDLVKYSFLIDWFIDVGGFLDRIDTRLRILELNIRYAICSYKRTMAGSTEPSDRFPFNGQVNWCSYHRWVTDQCPTPGLSLEFPITSFNHWLEASALLIQRRR